MPRAVWIGAISFGLVNIPVRLYPATSPRDPKFHLVDRETGRRIRYRRVVEEPPPPDEPLDEVEEADEGPHVPGPADQASPAPDEVVSAPPVRGEAASAGDQGEREVEYSDVARGFDVGDGRQVIVEREELEALRPEPSRTIDIEHFVALADVDPVHFEKSYQVSPADEIAEKPYALLRVAMERTGRVAVGRFVLRSREHLVLIRPTAGILGLETMYFADEVRAPEGRWPAALAAVEGALSDPEVEMAERLIEALAADWDPSRYEDPYRERVLDLIRSRAPQELPEEVEAAEPSVADLMAVLRASVDAAKDARRADQRPRRRAGGRGR
jgi:DNA end-binding protein Ku